MIIYTKKKTFYHRIIIIIIGHRIYHNNTINGGVHVYLYIRRVLRLTAHILFYCHIFTICRCRSRRMLLRRIIIISKHSGFMYNIHICIRTM